MKYLWTSYLCFQVINAAEVLECLFRWMNRAKCQDQLEEDTDTITMIDRGCYCNWGYYWSSSVVLCFPYYSCYLRLKEGLFFGHLISLFIKFIHTIFLFSINPPHWRTNWYKECFKHFVQHFISQSICHLCTTQSMMENTVPVSVLICGKRLRF